MKLETRSTNSSKPSIALAGESTGPGGAEMVILHLAEGLLQRGFRVHGIVPEQGGDWLAGEFHALGIETDVYQLRHSLDVGCVRSLVEILEHRQIDVLHSHEFTMAFFGTFAARRARVPHVITMHGSLHVLDALRRRLALKLAFRLSHAAVAVSSYTSRAYVEALGIRAERVQTIHNGIPDPRPTLTAEASGQAGEPEILAIGNLRPVKGHIDLVEAASLLHRENPDLPWKVSIAGEGPVRDELEKRIEEMGLAARVRLLGFRSDAIELLGRAAIYVMPSHSEGLPIALLESMALGTPAVASRVGGIPEVIDDGVTGLLVPAEDPQALAKALSFLLRDSSERDRLARAGRERFTSQFQVGRMVEDYERLYLTGLNE